MIRTPTIEEMRNQPEGTVVYVSKEAEIYFEDSDIKEGDEITRKHQSFDDQFSCAYKFPKLKDDYLYMTPEHVYIKDDLQAELGVYRPELETRKVGKIRVELVDDGFPLALREVAKVMTWAQTAKGYKDHDWQNLPNAEIALAAAASRHRTDHIKQRVVDDYAIEDCVDPESKLLHKAHEAFGVLAQLELMLRGEFA